MCENRFGNVLNVEEKAICAGQVWFIGGTENHDSYYRFENIMKDRKWLVMSSNGDLALCVPFSTVIGRNGSDTIYRTGKGSNETLQCIRFKQFHSISLDRFTHKDSYLVTSLSRKSLKNAWGCLIAEMMGEEFNREDMGFICDVAVNFANKHNAGYMDHVQSIYSHMGNLYASGKTLTDSSFATNEWLNGKRLEDVPLMNTYSEVDDDIEECEDNDSPVIEECDIADVDELPETEEDVKEVEKIAAEQHDEKDFYRFEGKFNQLALEYVEHMLQIGKIADKFPSGNTRRYFGYMTFDGAIHIFYENGKILRNNIFSKVKQAMTIDTETFNVLYDKFISNTDEFGNYVVELVY